MRKIPTVVDRAKRLIAHLSKFVLVGLTNSVIGYASFVVLQLLFFKEIEFGYFLSLAGSYFAAVPVAFLLYRRFVFISGVASVFQIARFAAVYIVSIAVNALGLWGFVEGFYWNALWAQLGAMVLAAATSYLGHRFISFRT